MDGVMYYCYYCCDEGWNYAFIDGVHRQVKCRDNCLNGRQWQERQDALDNRTTREAQP